MGRVKLWIFSGSIAVFGVKERAVFLSLTLILSALAALPPCLSAQTELGAQDDLTALGVNDTADDPDAEIKDFSVFASTQTSYPGAVAGPGNAAPRGPVSELKNKLT